MPTAVNAASTDLKYKGLHTPTKNRCLVLMKIKYIIINLYDNYIYNTITNGSVPDLFWFVPRHNQSQSARCVVLQLKVKTVTLVIVNLQSDCKTPFIKCKNRNQMAQY